MTKEQVIKKYNLKQYISGEIYFDLYKNTTEDDEKIIFYNLDNQISTDLKDSNSYFLTIQTIYKNKFITDRKTGIIRNKTRNQVIEITA